MAWLAFSKQVVHDQIGVALRAPASFIFTHAVLEIEHRITLAGIFVIIRRSIDITVTDRAAGLRIVENLAQLAMRHVLKRIKVLVLGRNFDAAAPAAGTVEIQAAGVRHLGTIHNDLIVVETFVLGLRVADPGTAIAFGQGIFYAANISWTLWAWGAMT